jgi:putative transposase
MVRGLRQSWKATFIREHAWVVIACDFCVVVTATVKMLFVLVVMASATRRILPC